MTKDFFDKILHGAETGTGNNLPVRDAKEKHEQETRSSRRFRKTFYRDRGGGALLGAFHTVAPGETWQEQEQDTAVPRNTTRSSKNSSITSCEQGTTQEPAPVPARTTTTAAAPFLFYPKSAVYRQQREENPLPPNMFRPVIPRHQGPHGDMLPDNDYANMERDSLLGQLARKNEVLVHGVADLISVLRAVSAQLPYLPDLVRRYMVHENEMGTQVGEQREQEAQRRALLMGGRAAAAARSAQQNQTVALAHALHAFWIHQNSLVYLLEDRAVILRTRVLAETRLRQIERDHRWLVRGLKDELFGYAARSAGIQ